MAASADFRVCCSESCRTSERGVLWNDVRHFAAFDLRLMILIRLATLAAHADFEENVTFAGSIRVHPRRCAGRNAALANARRGVPEFGGVQPVARRAHKADCEIAHAKPLHRPESVLRAGTVGDARHLATPRHLEEHRPVLRIGRGARGLNGEHHGMSGRPWPRWCWRMYRRRYLHVARAW